MLECERDLVVGVIFTLTGVDEPVVTDEESVVSQPAAASAGRLSPTVIREPPSEKRNH